MKKNRPYYLFLLITISLIGQYALSAQDINVKIGIRDSIKSEILNENRNILIHLPDDYHKSDQSYPIMFQLDGDVGLLMETTAIVDRLALREKIIPEMIIVAIENTNPFRDMWPTNTKYNPKPRVAGANDYLNFFEEELIPFIENQYRANGDRILYGQSLSSVFTIYTFLDKPKLFSSYLASSGGFPDCEKYFKELSIKASLQNEQFNGQKIFITNGLKDELDPNGEMNQTMNDFSNSIQDKLGEKISIQYLTYEKEGHVPFQSLYHGLKFIYKPSD